MQKDLDTHIWQPVHLEPVHTIDIDPNVFSEEGEKIPASRGPESPSQEKKNISVRLNETNERDTEDRIAYGKMSMISDRKGPTQKVVRAQKKSKNARIKIWTSGVTLWPARRHDSLRKYCVRREKIILIVCLSSRERERERERREKERGAKGRSPSKPSLNRLCLCN